MVDISIAHILLLANSKAPIEKGNGSSLTALSHQGRRGRRGRRRTMGGVNEGVDE